MSPERNVSAGAYAAAAWLLNAETRAVRAVAQIESGSAGAFNADGSPVVLFERHLFRRFTRGKFDGATCCEVHAAALNQLSVAAPGGYGSPRWQHHKLEAAVNLDRDAALRATSWGLFQILGDNHDACGYPDLQRFINAAYRSADDHVRAFVMFIRHDARLVDALRARDWETFARIYNGPGNVPVYSKRLENAYAQLA